LKKDRQHYGVKNEDKRTNNDLQNITKKTKDRATRTPLRSEVKSSAPKVYKNIKTKLSDLLTPWLLPLTLMVFVLFVLWLTTSGYSLWLLWSLFCLFSDLPLLVTPFDSYGLCFVCSLTYHFWLIPLTLMVFVLFVLWFTTSGYSLWLLWSLFVCSLTYRFWLLPLTLMVFVLFVLWLTTSG
jgi:hypothetical protein